MIDLTNPQEIKQLDPHDVFGSTGMLALQCRQIWEEAKTVHFLPEYESVDNVVVSGMGGSAYGGHVVKDLFRDSLKVPVYINNNYTLPAFVTERSLVILTSYSGSTEETLQSAKEAVERGAKAVILTSGGKLAEFKTENNLPGLVFTTQFNPSGQPRLGTGYVILGTIALLNQLKLISVTDDEVAQAITELETNHESVISSARDIATKLQGFIPVIFSADFLSGNAHIMRNQFNETAKTFSTFSQLPELNHHLLEGLKNPTEKKLSVLLVVSDLYPEKITKRITLTKEVVEKNNVAVSLFTAEGSSKISQVLSVLSFGGYITVYLALLYGQDPSLIPWVDYFKEQLAK